MNNLEFLKDIFIGFTAAIGGYLSVSIGGWNILLTMLVNLMIIDFLTGLVVSGVFKVSDKTETGRISPRICFQGIFKKVMIFFIIVTAYTIETVIGVGLKDAITFMYIIYEGISIIDNAKRIGTRVPKQLTDALESIEEHKEESGVFKNER